MKDESFYILCSRYTDDERLSVDEAIALARFVSTDQDHAQFLADDLAIHRLIQLFSEHQSDREEFVAACIDKFQRGSTGNQADHSLDIVVRNPVKARLAKASLQERKSRAKWTTALLTLASVILIGWFIVIIQNTKVNNDTQATRSPGSRTNPEADFTTKQMGTAESEVQLPSIGETAPANDAEWIAERSPDESLFDLSDSNVSEVVEKRSTHPEVPPDSIASKSDKNTFATVLSDSRTRWSGSPVGNRIGPQRLDLVAGNAVIALDNQSKVTLSGPAKIELISGSQIRIDSGKVLVDVQPGSSISDKTRMNPLAFEVFSRDLSFKNPVNAKIHIFVDPNGTEVVLSRGRLELIRTADDNLDEIMLLDIEDLSHAFVNNTTNQLDSIPAILVAHGRGKYLGQVGLGEQKAQSVSPDEFEKIVNQSSGLEFSEIQNKLSRSQIENFNKMFRRLRSQFEGNGNDTFNDLPAGYSFQGEIMIDGNHVEFSSRGVNESFKDRLEKTFKKFGQ